MGVVAILSGRVHSTFRIHYITVPTDVVGSNLNGDMNAQLKRLCHGSPVHFV